MIYRINTLCISSEIISTVYLRKLYISLHLLPIKSLCVAGIPPVTKPQLTLEHCLTETVKSTLIQTRNSQMKIKIISYCTFQPVCWHPMGNRIFLLAAGGCANANIFVIQHCTQQKACYHHEVFSVSAEFHYYPTSPFTRVSQS